MSIEFTPAQALAVFEERKEILVSASAGSGKTTVMIERILRLLSDGADLDSMIVCTFTKAAAADMRAKLLKRLAALCEEKKPWAAAALEKLPLAQISTIDSFCARIVREYFYYAGIDPAFELAEESAAAALLRLSAQEVIGEFTAAGDPDFIELYGILTPSRSEKKLLETVEKLYNCAVIRTDPEDWLDGAGAAAADHHGHLAALKGFYDSCLPSFLKKITALKTECAHAGFLSALGPLEKFYAEAEAGAALSRSAFLKPAGEKEAELSARFKKLRERYRDFLSEREEALASADPAFAAPHLEALLTLTRAVLKTYSEKKRKKALADFSDVEHYAYRILSCIQAAAAVNGKYRFLFVDEFQDINPLQDAIFDKLTAARFYVGDVKQSIYGFRLSEPAIFQNKCSAAETEARRVISLNANYRSDSGILSFCDRVFSGAMTGDFGGVDYASGAKFVSGRGSLFSPSVVSKLIAVPKEKAVPPEAPPRPVYSVRGHGYTENSNLKEAEANLVAEHILSLKKQTVTENGILRPVEFRDIAVLLRSVSGGFAALLAEKLRRASVPVSIRKTAGAEENSIIRILTLYLSLIDNRRDDVALAAVLKSVFGGFCSDADLARIRLCAKDAKQQFYLAADEYLLSAPQKDPLRQKLETLSGKLTRYAELSHVSDVGELAGRICADHEYFKYALGLPGGAAAASSLSRFLDGLSDLGGVSLWDALESIRSGAVKLSQTGESDAVQIMTVHASKGLEFPFAILPRLQKPFNLADIREDCILDSSLGAALKFWDISGRRTYKTSLWHRARILARKKSLEEELRLLYVALTRGIYQTALFAAVREDYEPKDPEEAGCALDFLYREMSPRALIFAPGDCAAPAEAVKRKLLFSAADTACEAAVREFTEFCYPYPPRPLKLSVTRLSDPDGGEPRVYAPFAPADPSGAEIGNAYHKFLETSDFGAAPEDNLQRFRKDYPELARRLNAGSAKTAALKIGERIGGRKAYRELPFLYRGEGGMLIQGVIDLLIESESGVEIVDYKTGKLSGALLKSYQKQVGLYAEAAGRVLCRRVIAKSIFSLHTLEFIEV